MAITTMAQWDVGYEVSKGDKASDIYNSTPANRSFSTANAQDLQKLLAQIVATLDELKGQL